MNKTKIDWADMTWNPVTGCLHGCEYCYARGIARRFANSKKEWKCVSFGQLHCKGNIKMPILDSPVMFQNEGGFETRICAYPAEFTPTFHRYRLDEPKHIKKPQRIFVCSMADLFGEWVPDEWIEQVFDACRKAPQHTYIFLTKNFVHAAKFRYRDNWWIGTSFTDGSLHALSGDPWSVDGINRANHFLSIEPILGPVNDLRYYLYTFKWVIIGAETGNRKGKVVPQREWVERIARDCRAAGVPVFMKESLRELMGSDFVQEWPADMVRR